MAATCPSGHASASEDYCDVCGLPIGAAPSLGPGGTLVEAVPGAAQWPGVAVAASPAPGGQCPECGVARTGNFCEACGYDFLNPDSVSGDPAMHRAVPPLSGPRRAVPVPPRTAPQPVTVQTEQPLPASPPPVVTGAGAAGPGTQWSAVVSADRAYYDAVQALGGPDAGDIAFPAYVPQRRFRLTGEEVRIGRHSASSGIDPEIDLSFPPADPGVSRLHAVLLRSPDGSYSVVDPGSANGTAVNGTEIPQGEAVPLADGDRIHLGAWTELLVVRDA